MITSPQEELTKVGQTRWSSPAVQTDVPLVVDVDGTLTPCDLFWEGVAVLLTRRWSAWPSVIRALPAGRAAVKCAVATAAAVDLEQLPISPQVQQLILEARLAGQPVILASGAADAQVVAMGERVEADAAWGCDPSTNTTGSQKLERLLRSHDAFDYVGNGGADIRLWARARQAYVVNPSRRTLAQLGRVRADAVSLTRTTRPLRALLRALRPHQWAKNALILVPALAAHLELGWFLLAKLLASVMVFSAVASAIYLLNDVADLGADRAHPRKRDRPIASGDLPIAWALAAIPTLLTVALLVMRHLSGAFALTVGMYALISMAYSMDLKRRLLVDVIVLALLYTTRVIAGGFVVGVVLSHWLLVFSLFVFFALAVAKRVVELAASHNAEVAQVAGRAYRPGDRQPMLALGAAATMVACLVFSMYITSPDVAVLYSRPELLWPILPLLLYWQARVWIFASRGSLHDDPIVFALRDRVSALVVLSCIACVVAST